ncbi:MAG: YetF domain-containing protein [Chitinophagales bacterium]
MNELLLGSENWIFLFEVVLRTFVMFVVILISLRLLGKRGVKQLSIFELVVIIGLGSAAGDPMFYKDVGLLPVITVFLLIISFFKVITFFVGKNKKIELLLEGKPVCLIQDGAFSIQNFKKESLGEDEFFAELRMQGVSQLGQIETAIEESSGSISIIFYPDDEVKYGLPIMPGSLDEVIIEITKSGIYACTFCGYTHELMPAPIIVCPNCKRKEWITASNKKRIG